MKLVTWNVQVGGGKRRPAQLALIKELAPDVLCLQELTEKSVKWYLRGLSGFGLRYCLHTFAAFKGERERPYGQLIASRIPLKALPKCYDGCPEALLSASLKIDKQTIEIHNAHLPPGSSNGWLKIDACRMIKKRLAVASDDLRILCGDFNAPQTELDDGTTVTWGQRFRKDGSIRMAKTIRGRPGEDWDAGERAILEGLADYDLPDVYRQLHGWSETPRSFVLRRKAGNVHRRFDHVFASAALKPATCEYLQGPLEEGLSDHAPMVVDFDR